jgi:hypothetical protein
MEIYRLTHNKTKQLSHIYAFLHFSRHSPTHSLIHPKTTHLHINKCENSTKKKFSPLLISILNDFISYVVSYCTCFLKDLMRGEAERERMNEK